MRRDERSKKAVRGLRRRLIQGDTVKDLTLQLSKITILSPPTPFPLKLSLLLTLSVLLLPHREHYAFLYHINQVQLIIERETKMVD
jgi:hypothetical protein